MEEKEEDTNQNVLKQEEKEKVSDEEFWKQKITKHWKAFTALIIGCVAATIGAIWVLFWFIDTSAVGAMGMATIGEWTVAWIWEFFIFLMLWELLIVGIPAAVAFGVGWYLWRKRLSDEEKAEFKGRWRGKGTAEGGGCGFFMFIAFSIYLYIQGDLYTPLGDHPYLYWVYSWFYTLGWLLVIVGIPAAIILTIVYFTVWHKKETPQQN
jgi:hypothetical protein